MMTLQTMGTVEENSQERWKQQRAAAMYHPYPDTLTNILLVMMVKMMMMVGGHGEVNDHHRQQIVRVSWEVNDCQKSKCFPQTSIRNYSYFEIPFL